MALMNISCTMGDDDTSTFSTNTPGMVPGPAASIVQAFINGR